MGAAGGRDKRGRRQQRLRCARSRTAQPILSFHSLCAGQSRTTRATVVRGSFKTARGVIETACDKQYTDGDPEA